MIFLYFVGLKCYLWVNISDSVLGGSLHPYLPGGFNLEERLQTHSLYKSLGIAFQCIHLIG